MKTLSLEKFQKSRESIVEAGGYGFTIRRPTVIDVARAGSSGTEATLEFAARFVVGWNRVLESDLIAGGDPEPVEFNVELFKVWVADRPDLWKPITTGVSDAYQRYEEACAARGKA